MSAQFVTNAQLADIIVSHLESEGGGDKDQRVALVSEYLTLYREALPPPTRKVEVDFEFTMNVDVYEGEDPIAQAIAKVLHLDLDNLDGSIVAREITQPGPITDALATKQAREYHTAARKAGA